MRVTAALPLFAVLLASGLRPLQAYVARHASLKRHRLASRLYNANEVVRPGCDVAGASASLLLWLFGSLALWVFWVFGSLGLWVFGSLNLWTFGSPAVKKLEDTELKHCPVGCVHFAPSGGDLQQRQRDERAGENCLLFTCDSRLRRDCGVDVRFQRDIAALRRRETSVARTRAQDEPEGGLKDFARGAFAKILLADFVLVLGFLGWFIVGVLQKYVGKSPARAATCRNALAYAWLLNEGGGASPILDSFRASFETLVQPALGLLMGGTLLGGLLEKLKEDNAERSTCVSGWILYTVECSACIAQEPRRHAFSSKPAGHHSTLEMRLSWPSEAIFVHAGRTPARLSRKKLRPMALPDEESLVRYAAALSKKRKEEEEEAHRP
eukprot:scaffold3643_cov267-Pinguiococcus_pyrenoidosus.AAC.3